MTDALRLLQEVDPAVASTFVWLDQASRITAYGLLIIFTFASFKGWVMWKWTHQELLDASHKLLEASNLLIEEYKKEIAELKENQRHE